MTNRIERLQRLLERENIPRQRQWLLQEEDEGPAGATLEMLTLFCAIKNELLHHQDADWLSRLARGHGVIKPELRKALAHLADMQVDPVLLGEVIRYFQLQIASMFIDIHAGTRTVDEADDKLWIHLTAENASGYAPDDFDRIVERMTVLPNALDEYFESFCECSNL